MGAILEIGLTLIEQVFKESTISPSSYANLFLDVNLAPSYGPPENFSREAAPGVEKPNLTAYPIWDEAFNQGEKYWRVHAQIKGIRLAEGEDASTLDDIGINLFGLVFIPFDLLFFGFLDFTPTALLILNGEGDDTGSTDYFAIAESSPFIPMTAKADTNNDTYPFWFDRKDAIIFKSNGTESILFDIVNTNAGIPILGSIPIIGSFIESLFSKTTVMQFSLPLSDLPELGKENAQAYEEPSDVRSDFPALRGAVLEFEIYVEENTDENRIVSEAEYFSIFNDTDTIDYSEHVLYLEDGFRAVVQAWQHKAGTDRAALWVIGRNDQFNHPHVANELFFKEGNETDLYVLNYRFAGVCIKRGFLADAFYVSHFVDGDIDLLSEEIEIALNLIEDNGPYDKVLGYGHSAGGTLLTNYVIRNGDDAFDAFLWNAPYYGFDNGLVVEFILGNYDPFLPSTSFAPGTVEETPEEFEDNPLDFLKRDIVLAYWMLWSTSVFYSEWSVDPRYVIPTTYGFTGGASQLFERLQTYDGDISSKPTLVLVSEQDDTIGIQDAIDMSLNFNENRLVEEFKYNFHDVFFAFDEDDANLAIQAARSFLEDNFY